MKFGPVLLILYLFIAPSGLAAGPVIPTIKPTIKPTFTACMGNRLWVPYSFTVNQKPAGTHVAMLHQAFKNLPYTLAIRTMPWNRCLDATKRGDVDAVFAAAYSDKREGYLLYPGTANDDHSLKNSFGELDFVIVTRMGTEFDAQTSVGIAPEPVGTPHGHLTVERNQAQNIRLVVGSHYRDLFELLKRGRVNSLVMPSLLVELYSGLEEFQDTFKTSPQTKEIGSVYLAISKKGKVNALRAQEIWHALDTIRNDQTLMQHIHEDAAAASRKCLAALISCQ